MHEYKNRLQVGTRSILKIPTMNGIIMTVKVILKRDFCTSHQNGEMEKSRMASIKCFRPNFTKEQIINE